MFVTEKLTSYDNQQINTVLLVLGFFFNDEVEFHNTSQIQNLVPIG